MKRLIVGSILAGTATFVACAAEAPPPVDNTTGGSAPMSGAGGTGQGGTTATGGTSGSGVGGATGGTNPTTGGTGGTTGGTSTGGAAGSASGSAGMSTGGSGGTSGAGGSGTGAMSGAGMGGAAGSMAGMGGTGDAGGMGATAGSPTGGMVGMSGAGGSAGAGEDLTAVAAPLDGQTILMPCDNDTSTRVCIPRADTSKPCTGTGPSYAGTHSFNEQVTMGGEPGVRYIVTLRIRGLTESKTYTGGTDRASSGTQVPADGLYTGGQADNSGNSYNVYFIRTDAPAQYFYLNSISVGNDTRIRHSVFESDYEFELPIDGGSTVCLVSADPNTSAIKNCEEPDVSTVCKGVSLPNLDAKTAADVGSQPYNGQYIGITVKSVRRM